MRIYARIYIYIYIYIYMRIYAVSFKFNIKIHEDNFFSQDCLITKAKQIRFLNIENLSPDWPKPFREAKRDSRRNVFRDIAGIHFRPLGLSRHFLGYSP